MSIVIREADGGDIDGLIRLHGRFMAHHAAGDDRFALRPDAATDWRERIAGAVDDADALVLVAVGNTGCIGCAYTLIRPGAMDFGPERIGYLCDVYVEPDHRRRGIARRFLAAAADWLRARGIDTLEASWAVNSAEACGTWPDLGFVPLSVSGRLELK